MKVCVKATQELGLNASEEAIEALDLVKYGPVREVEEIDVDLLDALVNEFELLFPDYKYEKIELCHME